MKEVTGWGGADLNSGDRRDNNRILLLGVGNVLLGDEGVGVHTVNRLRDEGLPDCVDAVDGGTAGLELAYLVGGFSRLVIVDCLDAGMEPGSIFRISPDDICGNTEAKISFHDLGLAEFLTMAKSMGQLPETVIFGIQPQKIDWGFGLSRAVEQKIEEFMDLVRNEFKQLN